MKNILLLHHLTFQPLPFFSPFFLAPVLGFFFQIDLQSFKIEQLEFHCLAVTPASSMKLGLLAYLSVTCMQGL